MRHEVEREKTGATTKLTYLLIGGGIGAILALLFAPKSGEELREDIADVTRKGIEKGKEAAIVAKDRAGETPRSDPRTRRGTLPVRPAEKAGEFKEAAELTEKAKEAARRFDQPFHGRDRSRKGGLHRGKTQDGSQGDRRRPSDVSR